jgi:putative SOS response-associated peptidase YedK
MCGRFARITPPKVIAERFGTLPFEDGPPRYNVAPTQQVLAVRQAADQPKRELTWLRWGLVPSWADDAKIGYKMINARYARYETAATKPAFRTSFRNRCLIPADGLYEWQATGAKKKQPRFISLKDGQPFAFSGLWERWRDAEGQPLESCTF